MNLTHPLTWWRQSAITHQAQLLLASLTSLLPAILVLCMLWQCTICMLKYLTSPMGANVAFSPDLSQSPIILTLCNRGYALNYTFPEMRAVDVRHGTDWETVWENGSAAASVTVEDFITVTHRTWLRFCKSIHIHVSLLWSELRLRHIYSAISDCRLSRLEAYLHSRGLFLSPDFSVILPRDMFASEEDFVLELNLETMISLPLPELYCSQDEADGLTQDSCLMAAAVSTGNQSLGCVAQQLRYNTTTEAVREVNQSLGYVAQQLRCSTTTEVVTCQGGQPLPGLYGPTVKVQYYSCTDEILISYVNSAKNYLTNITHSYFLVICV